MNDLQTINDELRLKDIDRLEKILEDGKKLRQAADKAKKAEFEVLGRVLEHVKSGKWVSDGNWKAADIEVINDTHLLTAKPVVYLVNMSQKDFARQKNKWLGKIAAWIAENNPGPIIPYSAAFEAALAELPDDEARAAYCKETGVQKSMIDKIIKIGYSALKLVHYFTCGADEVKCWTIREGTKAPQAAGIIHTDFEKGFICADVYKYADIVEHESESALRAAGKLRQQG